MGVYIKGMEMPKSCYYCPCIDAENGRCQAVKSLDFVYEYRPHWCPLVPAADVKDCVDRKGLRDALYEADAITFKGLAILDNFPAADVPSREVGKWIEQEKWTGVETFGFKEMVVGSFKCSACGFVVDVSEGNFDFCPHCGARMSHEDPSHPYADDVMMGESHE